VIVIKTDCFWILFASGNAEWERRKIALQRPKCINIMHKWRENMLPEYTLLSVYLIFIVGYSKNSILCTNVKNKTSLIVDKLLLLLLLFTEIQFSLGGSSPYISNKQE
jgi:hypothetical protein